MATKHEDHENSHIVIFYKALSMAERAHGPESEDYFASFSRPVGSYMRSKDDPRPATGLTGAEERLLVPSLIGMDPDEKGFWEKFNEFFAGLSTKVPKSGTRLQIGLSKSNKEAVTKDNMPLEVMDYIRYKVGKGHPDMAMNKEESEGNSRKAWYISDPNEIQVKVNKKALVRDEALGIYLEVKTSMEKVKMMLTLLGVDILGFGGKTKDDDMVEALHRFAETQPEEFSRIHNVTDMEQRFWIERMVKAGVLKRVATSLKNAENGKTIGHDTEEAILFFKDPENDEYVAGLKAVLQEAETKGKGKKKTRALEK